MALSSNDRQVNATRGSQARRNRFRPALETLEDRLVPATLLWEGDVKFANGDQNPNWRTDDPGNTNWINTTTNQQDLPSDGATLIFSDGGAVKFSSFNDMNNLSLAKIRFLGNTAFLVEGNSITLTDSIESFNQGSHRIDLAINLAAGSHNTDIASGGRLELSGVISGRGSVIKNGPGTLSYTGTVANTYGGITVVTEGTLELSKDANVVANAAMGGNLAIGDSSGDAGSALVKLLVGGQIPDTSAVGLTSDGALDMTNRTDTIGPLSLFGSQVSIGAGTLTVNGFLGIDGGSITATGAGKLVLGGNVGMSSGAQVPALIRGTLDLGASSRTFDIGNNPALPEDFIIDAAIIGGGGLTKIGTGQLVFQGAVANSFTGSTAVNDGTLLLAKSVINGSILGNLLIGDGAGAPGSAVVRLAAGAQIHHLSAVDTNRDGFFDVNGMIEGVGPTSVVGGAITIGTGELSVIGVLSMNGGTISSAGAGRLRMLGNFTNQNTTARSTISGTLDLSSNSHTFDVFNSSGGDGLFIQAVITGSGNLTKTGPGILHFGGVNTYSGVTAVNAGFLEVRSGSNLGLANGTPAAGTTVGPGAVLTLRDALIGIEPLTLDNPLYFGTGAIDGTGSWEGPITLASNSEVLALGTLSLIGNISGPGGLIKTGAGLLTLSGTNSYAGATTIEEGTVRKQFANSDVLPNNSSVTLAAGAVFDLNNFAETAGSLAGDGIVALQADGSFSVGGNGASRTFAGVITGAGSFNKVGNGALTLTGVNTAYTGLTAVAGGTLLVDGSLANSPTSVVGGAVLGGAGAVGPLQVLIGMLSPGASPAVFRSGNVRLAANTTFRIELNGAAAGAGGYDQLQVSGTVKLEDAVLDLSLGFAPPLGQRFTIIANDGADPVVGRFAGLLEGAYVNLGGVKLQISYRGGDGNDVVLTRKANIIVTSPDAGAAPRVRVFDAETQAPLFNFLAYPAKFKSGVRVATADVNGDGFFDIITASGPGTATLVKVFSGATQPGQTPQLLNAFKPYGNFKGGAFVAAGDVNGDRVPDIITGPGSGRAPTVMMFNGASGAPLGSFNAFPGSFKGGVTVAAGDVDGDGDLDIVAGMGSGNKPLVRVFDAGSRTPLASALGSFLAYPGSFKGGVYVAAGDLNGDGVAEVITGPGAGITPLVKVFTPATVATPRQILAYPPGQKRGVRVATGDINGDGKHEILTALGPKGNADVRVFNDVSTAAIDSFFSEPNSFKLGQFVAGSR